MPTPTCFDNKVPFSGSLITTKDHNTNKCLGASRDWHLKYRGADKSLARHTSRCILFDGENISFDASLVIHVNSTNIPQIMIINRIYENENLLWL